MNLEMCNPKMILPKQKEYIKTSSSEFECRDVQNEDDPPQTDEEIFKNISLFFKKT